MQLSKIKVHHSVEDLAAQGSGRFENLYFHSKPNREKVVVFFNGRIFERQLSASPIFHRWSWADKFRYSTIFVSDPVVGEDLGLTIGWYAGARDKVAFGDIWAGIRQLIDSAGLSDADVVTFGSSGGGFASIMSAIAGFSGKALAINPQTDIRKYHSAYSGPYLSTCWGEVEKKDERHISLASAFREASDVSPIVYAQNMEDAFHVKGHLLPLQRKIANFDLGIEFIEYRDAPKGHTPPDLTGLCEVFGSHITNLLEPGIAQQAEKVITPIPKVTERVPRMQHQCPICTATFGEFNPVTPRHTRKARCPSCGSVERHRFLWLLQQMDGIMPEGGRFLHFAPEKWLIGPMSERYGLGYVMADYELPPFDVKLDIQDMPFRDGLFGGILCFSVLEHIPDDYKAMQEMSRVLEPGGIAVIHVPLQYQTRETWREKLDREGRQSKYGQANHWRYYGLDIVDTLVANGFASAEMLKPSDKFSKDEIERYGLTNSSRLIFARKAR